MKRHVLSDLPYDWRLLLILAVIFLTLYVLAHYLVFVDFSTPHFDGSTASFEYGATLG